MHFIFGMFFLLGRCRGEILTLNSTEYARMPPLFLLEPYEPCLQKLWQCYFVSFALVSDAPSQLLDLIQEYSSFKVTHFNHTILQHGICIENSSNTNTDIKETLEFQLNETIWSKYKLKTKVLKYYDNNEDSKRESVDVIVAVIILGILFLNVIGSLYDDCRNDKDGTGFRLLLCFSIRQNWRKLVSPIGNSDPRLERLKSINGIRTLSTSLVIMSHAFLPALIYIDNPQAVEEKYRILIWITFPLGLLLILSASMFYEDRRSMPLRMAYAALAKPLDGFLLACFIFSSVLKYEDVYRGVVEWKGWTVPGRLSFSAYLLHASFVRYTAGVQNGVTHSTKKQMIQLFPYFLVVSYLAAFVFWLVVEAPLGQLVKLTFESRRKKKDADEKREKIGRVMVVN